MASQSTYDEQCLQCNMAIDFREYCGQCGSLDLDE